MQGFWRDTVEFFPILLNGVALTMKDWKKFLTLVRPAPDANSVYKRPMVQALPS